MAFGRAAAHPIYLPSSVSPSLALPQCFPLISSRTIVSGHAPTCSCQTTCYHLHDHSESFSHPRDHPTRCLLSGPAGCQVRGGQGLSSGASKNHEILPKLVRLTR